MIMHCLRKVSAEHIYQHKAKKKKKTKKKTYVCFRFPDPKHFIVNCEQNIANYAEKLGVM